MNSLNFTSVPSWISQPSHFQNVIDYQLSAIQDVTSFITLSDSAHFNSGFKQALYWRKQLTPSVTPNTVIFSFLGPQGLQLPNTLEVCRDLKGVCDMHNAIEIYRAPNSSFIGISFSNPDDANKVRSHFTYYNNSIVFHIKPPLSQHHDFKLLWLPPLFNIDRVHSLLNSFSSGHSIRCQLLQTDDHSYTPTNIISGTLQLSPGTSPQQLPHLIPLPSPHLGSALLIVSGRPPFCLKCKQEGHLRKTCPVTKCTKCHQFHLSSLPCFYKSYSSVLNDSSIWLDHVDDVNLPHHSDVPAFNMSVPISDTPTPNKLKPQQQEIHHTPELSTFNNYDTTSVTISNLPSSIAECHHNPLIATIITEDPTITTVPLTTLPSTLSSPESDHTPPLSVVPLLPFTIATASSLSTTVHEQPPSVCTSPPTTHRITRSMLSNSSKMKTSISDSPQENNSSSIFSVLIDEMDFSQLDTITKSPSSNRHFESSVSSISNDHQHSSFELSLSGTESQQSLSHLSKRKRTNSQNLSQQFSSNKLNSTVIPSAGDWGIEVDQVMPYDANVTLECSHSTLLEYSNNNTPQPNISSTISKLSPQVQTKSTSPSTCDLKCNYCENILHTLWPLRTVLLCKKCKHPLSENIYNRYYPIPGVVSLEVSLSPQDEIEPRSIRYMNRILDTDFVPIIVNLQAP